MTWREVSNPWPSSAITSVRSRGVTVGRKEWSFSWKNCVAELNDPLICITLNWTFRACSRAPSKTQQILLLATFLSLQIQIFRRGDVYNALKQRLSRDKAVKSMGQILSAAPFQSKLFTAFFDRLFIFVCGKFVVRKENLRSRELQRRQTTWKNFLELLIEIC